MWNRALPAEVPLGVWDEGRREAGTGWTVCVLRGTSVTPRREAVLLYRAFSCLSCLSRMSGEHPSSVSICKYLQDWVLCVVTYQQSEPPIP